MGALHTNGLHIVDLKTHLASIIPGTEGLWSPRASPDGRYFVGLYADTQRLMLFDPKTQRTTELVNAINVAWPEWSRDSQYVYFQLTSSAADGDKLVRVRIADRKLEEIKNAATQEIYALDVDLP